jgi:hypothetical protein
MGDKGLFELAYESFFLRDIAYLVSGLWLLLHLFHILFGYNLMVFIGYLAQDTRIFLIYGAMGYFLGMLSYLAALHIALINTDPPHFRHNYNKARNKINKVKQDEYIIRTLERSTFIQMACFSLAASSYMVIIVYSILYLMKYILCVSLPCRLDPGYIIAALVLGCFGHLIGKKEAIDEDKLLRGFAEEYEDTNDNDKKEENKINNTPIIPA